MWQVCSRYVTGMWQVCGRSVAGMWQVCGTYVACMWQVFGSVQENFNYIFWSIAISKRILSHFFVFKDLVSFEWQFFPG